METKKNGKSYLFSIDTLKKLNLRKEDQKNKVICSNPCKERLARINLKFSFLKNYESTLAKTLGFVRYKILQ